MLWRQRRPECVRSPVCTSSIVFKYKQFTEQISVIYFSRGNQIISDPEMDQIVWMPCTVASLHQFNCFHASRWEQIQADKPEMSTVCENTQLRQSKNARTKVKQYLWPLILPVFYGEIALVKTDIRTKCSFYHYYFSDFRDEGLYCAEQYSCGTTKATCKTWKRLLPLGIKTFRLSQVLSNALNCRWRS